MSDIKIYSVCMREELLVIKFVILLKVLLFDLVLWRMKCWYCVRFLLLVICMKYEVDVYFVKGVY